VFHASITRRAATAALALATVFAGGIATAPPAFSAQDTPILGTRPGAAIPRRYIVVLKDTASARTGSVAARARVLADRYQGKIGFVYERTLSGFSVGMSEAAARRLAADPEVDYVEQDQVVRLADTQENPPSWGLDRIDQRLLPLDTTYSYDLHPSTVTAYIIDTGVRTTHADFEGRASSGWDFISGDATAEDCHGHGTHVAATVAGKSFGVAKNAKVVAVRAFNCSGTSTESSVQSAVEWITTNAVKPAIANLSIEMACSDASGNPAPCPVDTGKAIKTAISKSITAGIHYVIAAGNQNIDGCGNPFNQVFGTLVVGAVTSSNAKEPNSNWGACLDLWAPGQGIVSADIVNDTSSRARTGTSMAAPHVAGALAQILARPGWAAKTPAEAKAQLMAETTPGVVTGLTATSPNKLVYAPPPPMAGGSSVALARNADGRLTLFGVNRAGTLFVRSQTQPSSTTWTPWLSSVDPNWYSVCADTDSQTRIKLAGLRRNEEIWHRSQAVVNANSWTIWQKFDGLLTACAVAYSGTKLDVFGVNRQGQLWRRTEVTPGGAYTAWSPVGGVQVLRSVAAERNSNGLVEVFGLTRGGEIWHCWATASNCGAAGSWVQLDGQLSTIAVTRSASVGSLSVLGVNSVGQLFFRRAALGTNNWFSWSQLDVPATGGVLRSVATETMADGRILLVAVNAAGQIWHRAQTAPDASTFGPWVQLDGLLRP